MDRRLLDGSCLPNSEDMSTFGKFVDLCEARGMKVVLDMVVNHSGYGAQGEFDAMWFNVRGSGDIKGELAGLPDFNHDNPEVLDFFINNTEDWITMGKVTNIRMDTVKLWSDDMVYAFLRIATDDVALVIINNGYTRMPNPIQLNLDMSIIPQRVADMVAGGLKHWKTGQALTVQNGKVPLTVDGKTIDIFCSDGPG